MIRKLFVLLLVSTIVISVNALEIFEQKPEKKIEVTISSVVSAAHNNAYLVALFPNLVLFILGLSQDLNAVSVEYDRKSMCRAVKYNRSLKPFNDSFALGEKISFFCYALISACCIRLVYVSFWTLLGGTFIKHMTKECDVNQEPDQKAIF